MKIALKPNSIKISTNVCILSNNIKKTGSDELEKINYFFSKIFIDTKNPKLWNICECKIWRKSLEIDIHNITFNLTDVRSKINIFKIHTYIKLRDY